MPVTNLQAESTSSLRMNSVESPTIASSRSLSYASGSSSANAEPYAKSIATVRMSVAWPGIFALKLIVIPSCGCMRRTRTLGCAEGRARSANRFSGGLRKWTEISVARRESRLPVRSRKGTPAHRHESSDTRRAAYVSVPESGATSVSWR
jgi:hypothetical protein